MRVRAAYVERSTGEILLGPPKSRAGRRVVGIPAAIIPELRRSNFNKLTGWSHAVRSIGADGLHVHDLRHTGHTFAASSGAGLRDLMVRMGHDSERAALIYQHEARGADQRITAAIDAYVEAERSKNKRDDDSDAGAGVQAG